MELRTGVVVRSRQSRAVRTETTLDATRHTSHEVEGDLSGHRQVDVVLQERLGSTTGTAGKAVRPQCLRVDAGVLENG